jgi:ABC-type nitrate/sulfonate/bicarbonate transport system substrate-binding protein
VIQALATGKADAGAGLIGDWLKPLEQGFDVKLFVGSHGGCGRLFASEKSGVKDLKDLKGKTIATFVMGASPQTVLQVSIFKAGVDPNADVDWKVVPFDLVGERSREEGRTQESISTHGPGRSRKTTICATSPTPSPATTKATPAACSA